MRADQRTIKAHEAAIFFNVTVPQLLSLPGLPKPVSHAKTGDEQPIFWTDEIESFADSRVIVRGQPGHRTYQRY